MASLCSPIIFFVQQFSHSLFCSISNYLILLRFSLWVCLSLSLVFMSFLPSLFLLILSLSLLLFRLFVFHAHFWSPFITFWMVSFFLFEFLLYLSLFLFHSGTFVCNEMQLQKHFISSPCWDAVKFWLELGLTLLLEWTNMVLSPRMKGKKSWLSLTSLNT